MIAVVGMLLLSAWQEHFQVLSSFVTILTRHCPWAIASKGWISIHWRTGYTDSMADPKKYNWHRSPWMRGVFWMLLPLLLGGLVLITAQVAFNRPPSVPEQAE